MTSINQLRKDVDNLKQKTGPTRKIILHMWLPPDDPRHHMTFNEILQANNNRNVVIVPSEVKP